MTSVKARVLNLKEIDPSVNVEQMTDALSTEFISKFGDAEVCPFKLN